MSRRFVPLVLLLCTAPAPALAQAWPAGAVVSIASVRAPPPGALAFVVTDPAAPRAAPLPRPDVTPPPLRLKTPSALAADNPPQVDVRAKAEWSDDQGFRTTLTKVHYKLRF